MVYSIMELFWPVVYSCSLIAVTGHVCSNWGPKKLSFWNLHLGAWWFSCLFISEKIMFLRCCCDCWSKIPSAIFRVTGLCWKNSFLLFKIHITAFSFIILNRTAAKCLKLETHIFTRRFFCIRRKFFS